MSQLSAVPELIGRVGSIVSTRAGGGLWEALRQAGNELIPVSIPEPGDLFKQFVQGWISRQKLTEYLRKHGVDLPGGVADRGLVQKIVRGKLRIEPFSYQQTDDPNLATLWQSYQQMGEPTIAALFRRGIVTATDAHVMLRLLGWGDWAQRQSLIDLTVPVPDPLSAIQLGAMGALDPAVAREFGGLNEYSADIQRVLRANGLGLLTLPAIGPTAEAVTLDTALLAWINHWQMPSVSDALKFWRLFRPSLDGTGAPAHPSGIILPESEFTRLMRVNSILPEYRQAMAQASFTPISLRHLDNLYEFGELNVPQMADVLVSEGNHPINAAKIARARAHKVDRQRRRLLLAQSRAQIERAWELGSIGDADYLQFMRDNDLSADEAQQALALAQVGRDARRVERLLRTIRQQVLTGQMSLDDARTQLLNLAVNPERVADYLQDWELELGGRRRMLSARENLKAAEGGLLALPDLMARLRNLRYNDADIQIFLGELQLNLAARLARAAAAAERAREKSQKDALRAAQLARQAQEQARRALATHGSPAKLKTWYCSDEIGEIEVYERLRFLGWPDIDINRLLQECNLKKAKNGTSKSPGS